MGVGSRPADDAVLLGEAHRLLVEDEMATRGLKTSIASTSSRMVEQVRVVGYGVHRSNGWGT